MISKQLNDGDLYFILNIRPHNVKYLYDVVRFVFNEKDDIDCKYWSAEETLYSFNTREDAEKAGENIKNAILGILQKPLYNSDEVINKVFMNAYWLKYRC
jgi:hypothetical protein